MRARGKSRFGWDLFEAVLLYVGLPVVEVVRVVELAGGTDVKFAVAVVMGS